MTIASRTNRATKAAVRVFPNFAVQSRRLRVRSLTRPDRICNRVVPPEPVAGKRSRTKIRHRQNNCKAPTLAEERRTICGTEFAPLGESGGTVQLEIFAAVEMALPIEMVVYG